MQSSKLTIRKLACSAGLALTALAALPTVAAGGGSSAIVIGPPEQRALVIRSQALNCKHGRAETCMTPAAFRALRLRSEALNRKYGIGTTD